MAFQQATIPVQNAEAFGQLKSLIEKAVSTANAPKLLKEIVSAGLTVWKLEAMLPKSLLEKAAGMPAGQSAKWYSELSLSDQGQIREFYLTRIEQMDAAVRVKYKKAYRYL
jgi:hypothetical protein